MRHVDLSVKQVDWFTQLFSAGRFKTVKNKRTNVKLKCSPERKCLMSQTSQQPLLALTHAQVPVNTILL